MKRIAFAILIAVIAAAPAAAMTKKKVKKQASTATVAAPNSNQNSANLAKDGLTVFVPGWAMPEYTAVSGPRP